MFVVPVILWIASLTDTVAAAASCPTSYCPIPGWPQGPTTTVCYDTSYYRNADQGQLSGSGDLSLVLMQKCEASCTTDSNCKAIVGATQYAADSNLATGVCFFYDHIPSPRQCTDSSKRGIRAESKNTVCSSTTTTTKSTTTTTKSTTSTTKSTTSTTTTSKPTTTTSSSTTSSSTTSSSTTSSSTTSSSTTSRSTTSSSTTSRSTTSSSTTSSSTTSSSTTSSSTTSSSTTSSSTTTSSTTTTSTTSTSTTKAAAATNGVVCDPAAANGNSFGGGGCSSNCVCDPDTDGYGRCTQVEGSGTPCATDADCPNNGYCDAYYTQPLCLDSNGCSSTYKAPNSKRDVFDNGLSYGGGVVSRVRRVARKPLKLKRVV